jgi:hypothetical protein
MSSDAFLGGLRNRVWAIADGERLRGWGWRKVYYRRLLESRDDSETCESEPSRLIFVYERVGS